MARSTGALLCLFIIAGCGGGSSSGGSAGSAVAPVTSNPPTPAKAPVVVQLGAEVPAAVESRVLAHLKKATARPLEVRAATAPLGGLPAGTLVLGFGATEASSQVFKAGEIAALAAEGFALRSKLVNGVTIVATDGRPAPSGSVNRGLAYGTYALLEELGFAFLHPLAPHVPSELETPVNVDRREAPRWPIRGIHLHTMHPLELTELLNGWGPGGPQDAAGWAAMLPEWDAACEWMVANRQNHVEWFLLSASSWKTFAEGPERRARLTEIVRRAHEFGIRCGADIPLALRQQHAWYMIQQGGDLAREVSQIKTRLDTLATCGFDFYATELGTSEFTSTDDRRMVAWLDAFATHAKSLGKASYAKIHCSTGQKAKNFPDPNTGQPINYNFLPHYADPALGVMPHTVQFYALDDPAPTYNNTDFGYMRRFLEEQAGRREVLWHPETAYWVSFDNDVPLFLPVYADRRVRDMRLIAQAEDAGRVGRGPRAGSRIDGQMFFSSGWEWGYWLNDVVAARLAWDPLEKEPSDEAALRRALAPVVRPFGAAADAVRDAIVDLARTQRELFIHGRVNGQAPGNIVRRNAQGYLQGWESFDDLSVMHRGILPLHPTQPEKLGLVEMTSPLSAGPDYRRDVAPLLAATETEVLKNAAAFDAQRSRVPAAARPLFDELADSARITALRATQVRGLYEFVQARHAGSPWQAPLREARDALDAAVPIVARRERAYRVPADRIAGWRQNPTSYEFTYLWTVRSLHYWWRDESKAVDAPRSPFHMNIIDPLDVAFGEGFWIPLAQAVNVWGAANGWANITQGLTAPAREPVYPPQGLRNRP